MCFKLLTLPKTITSTAQTCSSFMENSSGHSVNGEISWARNVVNFLQVVVVAANSLLLVRKLEQDQRRRKTKVLLGVLVSQTSS